MYTSVNYVIILDLLPSQKIVVQVTTSVLADWQACSYMAFFCQHHTCISLCIGHWLFCRDICQPFDKCSYSHILPYVIYQDRTQSQDRPSYSYELTTCTSAFAPADPVEVEAMVTVLYQRAARGQGTTPLNRAENIARNVFTQIKFQRGHITSFTFETLPRIARFRATAPLSLHSFTHANEQLRPRSINARQVGTYEAAEATWYNLWTSNLEYNFYYYVT